MFRDDLRAVVPTLEPDDAFVAELCARASAGSVRGPAAAAWRVALAPVAVAAVLIGIAWVTGIRPAGLPDPSPAPAPTTSVGPSPAPAPTGTAADPRAVEPGATTSGRPPSTDPSPAGHRGRGPGSEASTGPRPDPTSTGPGTGSAQGHGQAPGHGQTPGARHGHRHPHGPARSHGLDQHAGDHPAPQASRSRHHP